MPWVNMTGRYAHAPGVIPMSRREKLMARGRIVSHHAGRIISNTSDTIKRHRDYASSEERLHKEERKASIARSQELQRKHNASKHSTRNKILSGIWKSLTSSKPSHKIYSHSRRRSRRRL